MFYKAANPKSGNMWDVWVYHHDGTYYLYSLCATDQIAGTPWPVTGIATWDNYSLASSPDGVHWKEIGPVITKDDGVKWMGTGSTWRNPVPGGKPAFQINYSSCAGRKQSIFFAQSDDLVHWTKCGLKNEFVPDERWYQPNGVGRWDCIWAIPRPGGGLYGYWTASPKPETGGQFGFGESLDGITWKALEPPKVHGVGAGDVGAIEKIGDRYVMLFGLDMRMVTLVADRPQGPFTPLDKNRVILGGHTYFARFVRSPTGMLVSHHSIARDGQVSFGLLKGTNFDAEGNLRLTWWPGNEALKHRAVAISSRPAGDGGPVVILGRELDAAAGFALEGKLKLPTPPGAPRGLYVEHAQGIGTAILFHSDGRAEIGPMGVGGEGFKPEIAADREIRFGAPARFRLVLKGSLMEVYLDDVLIECYSLPASATGRIGLIPGNQRNSVSALKAWT
jgi:hypothetical protein